MNIDAELLLSENHSISAATDYSAVKRIGPSLKLYHPLFCDVKLTKGFTSGRINKIKVQTSDDPAFVAPIDLIEITLLAGIDQTKAANLAHFRMPLETKTYIRLQYTSTAPAGGLVWAQLVKEVPLR